TNALVNVHLQPVIPGIADRFVQSRLEECRIVHRLQPWSAEPKITEGQGTLQCGIRSKICRHQGWLRRITIHHAELMKSPVADIVDIDGKVPKHLTLDAEIPC